MRLRYYPVLGRERWYVGTVDGQPFQLGNAWCVTLRDMPADYAIISGKNGIAGHTVHAASLDNCEPHCKANTKADTQQQYIERLEEAIETVHVVWDRNRTRCSDELRDAIRKLRREVVSRHETEV